MSFLTGCPISEQSAVFLLEVDTVETEIGQSVRPAINQEISCYDPICKFSADFWRKVEGHIDQNHIPKSISSADMNLSHPLLGFPLLHCQNPPTLQALLAFLLLHHQNPPTLQLPLVFLLVHYQNPHHHLRFKPQRPRASQLSIPIGP